LDARAKLIDGLPSREWNIRLIREGSDFRFSFWSPEFAGIVSYIQGPKTFSMMDREFVACCYNLSGLGCSLLVRTEDVGDFDGVEQFSNGMRLLDSGRI
jgi:hypothetical protein